MRRVLQSLALQAGADAPAGDKAAALLLFGYLQQRRALKGGEKPHDIKS
jgi:hypothetical protein